MTCAGIGGLQEAVNTQHVHPRLRDQTPAQHRKGLRLAKLPPGFVVPTGRLPLSAGARDFHPPGEPGRDGVDNVLRFLTQTLKSFSLP